MSTLYQSHTGFWEVVIGLEVHAQIVSQSKLFSSAPTQFGAEPNTQVSFVDAAFPGMLPVLNSFCVDQAIKTGLGLNACINPVSIFERKNYFYPDLPSGYQISQYQYPIVGEGWLDIELTPEEVRRIGIERLHLEQDAGKSIHDISPNKTYIDLNRAGIGLMEIVTKPDMRSSVEAVAFLKKLRMILRYLETCDGNMEEGSLRADVNISVRHPGEPLGVRAEIKNVNSMRFVDQAIIFETKRQVDLLEMGNSVVQETRLFDANTGETRSMRNKEDAQDYRYFPDPDLLPLRLKNDRIERIRIALPELPDAKKARFIETLGLSPYNADLIVSEPEYAVYYETSLKALGAYTNTYPTPQDAKVIANWFLGDFFAHLNRTGFSVENTPITPSRLAGLARLVLTNVISGRIAKDVFSFMETEEGSPEDIVARHGLKQVTDISAIEHIIRDVLAKETEHVTAYKAGKDKLFGYFVGQVMKASQGKANPQTVNDLLKKLLE
ncbi:MAG: Asp-tRNA(Asn)/Glu-tRNA(Gln) amidotransferase subunit GatB [Holosporales bacterium]|jgi:aspartyl-tRNA(Asn)/glutamyl-tRNA(Gln) amidotransferase subunit B|nr:Asp-tRNA(Asn)/Glu-tRNA(Gln) amidotransferase subunit GatB [Holosporales bacterium]